MQGPGWINELGSWIT